MKRNINFTIVLIIIVVLLVFLHFIKVLSPVESAFSVVLKPFEKGVYKLSSTLNSAYYGLKNIRTAEKENKFLKEQNQELLLKQGQNIDLQQENEFLRQQIDFLQKTEYDGTIARVIGKSSDLSVNALIVDQGAKHGVEVGQPVVAHDGFLIGKVLKVNKYTSLVLLVTDNFSKVAVSVLNQAKTVGLVEGEYGLGIRMNFIPPAEEIHENDLVITSGIEDLVPRGLVVGEINAIEKRPESLFQEASIKSPVAFDKLYLVNILRH